MVTYADIRAAHDEIRAFRASDSSLATCSSGYSFNWTLIDGRPVDAAEPVDVIIMGMNPGEDAKQESGFSKRSATRWETDCQSFAKAVGGRWAVSEMIFWSSHDIAQLMARVGVTARYLEFCARHNLTMINFHRPKVIFQPGLTWAPLASTYYNLRHQNTVKRPEKSGRLLEHYVTPEGVPWLSTLHWTAFPGLTNDDRNAMKSYAAGLLAAR